MSDVWVVSGLKESETNAKLGLREKFFGEDWEKPTHNAPILSSEMYTAFKRHAKGKKLSRNEFPEAAYVFSEKHFKRFGDFFYVSGFKAITGRFAKLFANADLGDGELIPFPIYKEDKKTPYSGEFFLLNLGAQKDSFLPQKSNPEKVEPFFTIERDGVEVWRAKLGLCDHDITVSRDALSGADIWYEPKLTRKFFLSGNLMRGMRLAGIRTLLDIKKCHVVEQGS